MGKWCKNCKHGSNYCDKNGFCTYCQISPFNYPVRMDQNDTCDNWEDGDKDG